MQLYVPEDSISYSEFPKLLTFYDTFFPVEMVLVAF